MERNDRFRRLNRWALGSQKKEQGYIDYRRTFFGPDGQKPPGRVFYTDDLLQRFATADPAFMDAIVVNGDNVANGELRPYVEGMDSLAIVERSLKQLANNLAFDVTSATGKLKLLIQGSLGNHKVQNNMWLFGAVGGLTESRGLLTTGPTGSGSSNEPTTYWIVTLRPAVEGIGDIGFQQLDLKRGQKLIPFIEKSGISQEDKDFAEVWALCDARPIDTPEIVVPLNSMALKGDVIDYGWAANWSGTEYSVVTTEPYRIPPAVAGNYDYHIQRRYTITINPQLDISAGTWSFEVQLDLDEEVNATPRTNVDLLLFPDRLFNRHEYYYWQPLPGGYSNGLLFNDSPIYSWYDRDDLIVVRHLLEETPGNDNDTQTINEWLAASFICSPGAWGNFEFADFRDDTVRGGFYIDGFGAQNQGDTQQYIRTNGSDGFYRNMWLGADTGGPHNQEYPNDPVSYSSIWFQLRQMSNAVCNSPEIPVGAGVVGLMTNGTNFNYTQQVQQFSRQGESAFVIPFRLRDGGYIGFYENDTGLKDVLYNREFVNRQFVGTVNGDAVDMVTGVWGDGRSGNLGAGGIVTMSDTSIIPSPEPLPIGVSLTFFEFKVRLDLYAAGINTGDPDIKFVNIIDVDTSNDAEPASYSQTFGKHAAFWNPILYGDAAYPYFNIPFNVAISRVKGNYTASGDYTGDTHVDRLVANHDFEDGTYGENLAINSGTLAWTVLWIGAI